MRHHALQFAVICAFALAGLVLTLSPTVAAPPTLPPRPVADPTPTDVAAPARAVGAWIQVQGPVSVSQDVWVVVQWQDSLGNWNDVDSWRGQYDSISNNVGVKTWWVDQTLFGATMFRWTAYDKKSGQVVSSTSPFSLPNVKNQTLLTVLP